MARIIEGPTRVEAHGNIPKVIEEFIGRVNTGTKDLSVALMNSPAGWEEPGQTPAFDEFTLVLEGSLTVESKEGKQVVHAGQAIIAPAGEWVRYSSPDEGGARYIALCVPACSPDTVNRDEA